MMKLTLPLFMILTLSHLAISAEPDKTVPEQKVYGGTKINEDGTLNKLLTLPSVAPKYEKCKIEKKALEEIPACVWSALSLTEQAEVQKLYAKEESMAPAKDSGPTTNLTGRSNNIQTDYSSDPAVKALSTFFGKKLDEVLNGTEQDKKDKKNISVDHATFINLYTSSLGKAIVNAFTSYCMETDPACRNGPKSLCLISNTEGIRKDHIQENLKTINKADLSAKEGEGWTHCISSVSEVCYNQDSNSGPDLSYSKQRACLVMDFVKSARKNLIASDQQKIFYKGLTSGGNIEDKRLKLLDEKDLAADKLTQITSADIDKDVKQANDQTLKEATDCEAQISKEKCDKFLDENKSKNNDAVAEFGLRQFAKENDLNDKLSDKKNISSYLKEEGYSQDQIAALTKDESSIEAIRQEIKDRFKNEKEAIIKEMAGRITAKTTTQDGSINSTDKTLLSSIKTDLSTRTEDLKNLVHFNNIVSSYLNISEGDGKSQTLTRNTASLYAEVNSMNENDSKVLRENIEKSKKDLKENQTTADLKVEDINEILKYNDPPPIP